MNLQRPVPVSGVGRRVPRNDRRGEGQATGHASRIAPHVLAPCHPSLLTRHLGTAFTLIELLTVISIIAILVAIVGPVVTHFRKGDATLAATQQMLQDVASARQLAISRHTTVYMIFVPPTSSFWNGVAPWSPQLPPAVLKTTAITNLITRQSVAYTFVTLRSVGDQPGQYHTNYLAAWRTLPDGAFIATYKFNPPSFVNGQPLPILTITDPVSGSLFPIYAFNTNAFPFPTDSPTNPVVILPDIAFNYLGQLVSGRDEYVPLAAGSVLYSINPSGVPTADALEQPLGNSTNSYNLIHIDWLTGRARLERQEVR